MPRGETEHLKPYQWKPGQSGNAGGSSKGRRLTRALIKKIKREKLTPELLETWLAMALGKKVLLGDREPEWAWFREILNRVDGPVKDAPESHGSDISEHKPRLEIPEVDE